MLVNKKTKKKKQPQNKPNQNSSVCSRYIFQTKRGLFCAMSQDNKKFVLRKFVFKVLNLEYSQYRIW